MRARLRETLRERDSCAVPEVTAAAALVVLFVALSLVGSAFLTADNLFNIGAQTAAIALHVYALAGLLVDVAGVVGAFRVGSGRPHHGAGPRAGCRRRRVIGGASLYGGQGRVVGILIGTFLIALVGNSPVLLGLSLYPQQGITGLIA